MALIEVAGLKKSYGATQAVRGVDFEVEEGEIFGILGPNGAGKTTTVECVAGIRTPDAGRISVLGLDPRTDRAELRQVLGVQLQESRLPERLRVGEALDLFASFYRRPADQGRLLHDFGLQDKRRTPVKALSGGQQQRLSIALALVGSPKVAVLDELTTGLDPRGRRDTWQVIEQVRDRGVTVVLVTHFMEEAERLCDRIALIDQGRIAALDTPAALISGVSGDQRLRFRSADAVDQAALSELDEVVGVIVEGRTVTVTGSGDVTGAVEAELRRQGVSTEGIRAEATTLEDAYLSLTGRSLGAHADSEGADA
ncbi:sulfate ABC transporter ATPase [Streptomyces sp. CB00316]|nr:MULTISPECIES: ABC transporter ATP-binding protein [unclassified Streptomyces]MBT2428908.1 ABC transporter ATP-binding protein [Streptomyces sp. ISL-112]MBT2464194.1 ABC transporter ATP-binding protein [Streptomyces sp. ISL-63]OKJ20131.1 sulfate ABC transporter ATPase [Streptomyces sp. CB00316]